MRKLGAVVCLLFLLLSCAGSEQIQDSSTSEEVESLQKEVSELREQLTEAGLYEPTEKILPDGLVGTKQLLGFVRNDDIFVLDFSDLSVRQITDHFKPDSGLVRGFHHISFHSLPRWSPDGEQVLYGMQDGEKIKTWVTRTANVDGTGSQIVPLFKSGSAIRHKCSRFNASWSPDGKHFLFQCDANIFLTKTDGTDLKKITSFESKDEVYSGAPAWSQDGKYISFLQYLDDSLTIVIVTRDGAEIYRSDSLLIGSGRNDHMPAFWSPEEPYCRENPRGSSTEWTDCTYSIAYFGSKDGEKNQWFTSESSIMEKVDETFRIDVMGPNYPGSLNDLLDQQWTKDGLWGQYFVWHPKSRVTGVYADGTENGPEIFRADWSVQSPDSQNIPYQITNNKVADLNPVWSPDGRWIAYRSEREGSTVYLEDSSNWDIYIKDASGEETKRFSIGEVGIPFGWINDPS